MRTVVVGLEGAWPAEAAVAWGAAAIARTDAEGGVSAVRNGITGHAIRQADFAQLLNDGAITETPKIAIDDNVGQVVVFAVRRAFQGQSFFLNDVSALARRGTKEFWYRVYEYPQQFERFVGRVVNDVTGSILREPARSDADAIMRALAIMAPQDPLVHATRRLVAPEESKRRVDRTARATLDTQQRRKDYEQLIRVLEGESYRYELKYTGGIAEGGGMDLDRTVTQLSALERLHKAFRPILVKKHAIFESQEDVPAPRLYELRAASAGLHFEVNIKGEAPLARLARFFELRMLEDAVSGQIEEELSSDVSFMEDMQTLLHPSDDTLVEQKRPDAEEYQEIEFAPITREKMEPADRFVCFCFLQGIISEARNVELKVAPKLRYTVSTRNNGFGGPPEGVSTIARGREFLFEATVASLTRFTTPSRTREKIYAEGLHVLASEGPAEFSWIPSFLAPGAFLRVGSHRAHRDRHGVLLLDGSPVMQGLLDPRHERIAGWLELFARWCVGVELESSPRTEDWIVPVRPRDASALARVLDVLQDLDGSAPFDRLVTGLQERYGSRVRPNNTRRAIAANSRFVRLLDDEGDDETRVEARVELTADGVRAARVYRSYTHAMETAEQGETGP